MILDDERRYFLAGCTISDATQIIYGQGTIDNTAHGAEAAAMSVKTEK